MFSGNAEEITWYRWKCLYTSSNRKDFAFLDKDLICEETL